MHPVVLMEPESVWSNTIYLSTRLNMYWSTRLKNKFLYVPLMCRTFLSSCDCFSIPHYLFTSSSLLIHYLRFLSAVWLSACCASSHYHPLFPLIYPPFFLCFPKSLPFIFLFFSNISSTLQPLCLPCSFPHPSNHHFSPCHHFLLTFASLLLLVLVLLLLLLLNPPVYLSFFTLLLHYNFPSRAPLL